MHKKRIALAITLTLVVTMFLFIAPVIYTPAPPIRYTGSCPENYACTAFNGFDQAYSSSVSETLFRVGACFWASGSSQYYGVSELPCTEFMQDYGATNFPCYWIFCVWSLAIHSRLNQKSSNFSFAFGSLLARLAFSIRVFHLFCPVISIPQVRLGFFLWVPCAV